MDTKVILCKVFCVKPSRKGCVVHVITHRRLFRRFPGGVERRSGRNALQRAFSQGVGEFRPATTPIIRHILGGVYEVRMEVWIPGGEVEWHWRGAQPSLPGGVEKRYRKNRLPYPVTEEFTGAG